MAEALSFEPPRAESISLLEIPAPQLDTIAGAVTRCFEFSCRGDRVPLTLISPESGPSRATLLVQPLPGDPAGLPGLRGLRSCLGAGVALAAIELPLFGSRRSPKLSKKLTSAVASCARGETVGETSLILWTEFVRQSVLELRRALDVLDEIPDVRAEPVAFAGVGLGASVGAIACAADERPVGCVLVGAGGGFGPAEIDPATHVGRISPRPLLLVTRETGGAEAGAPPVTGDQANALAEAAGEPLEVESQSGSEVDLLGPAWRFLSPLLER